MEYFLLQIKEQTGPSSQKSESVTYATGGPARWRRPGEAGDSDWDGRVVNIDSTTIIFTAEIDHRNDDIGTWTSIGCASESVYY